MACAKFSVLQTQKRLMGDQTTNIYMMRLYPTVSGLILAWTVFSILALALQCGTASPQLYQPDRCLGGALWYPVALLNAVTDAVLAFSFTPVILRLAMAKERKVRVMCLFGTRTL